MKIVLWVVFLLLLCGLFHTTEKINFDDYFIDATLRVDFYHTGDHSSQLVTLDKLYREGIWAGNPSELIDPFNNGEYYIKVYDSRSGCLIFSKGFDSYCSEYVTTEKAKKGIKRTFHESALVPFPRQRIRFCIEKRDSQTVLHPLFEQEIEPNPVEIINENPDGGIKVIEYLKNGHPHKKVDFAILAEGYTAGEFEQFKKDLETVMGYFFAKEPYKKYKSAFNVYGVFKASPESGTDEPLSWKYRNTALGTTFNALGLDRYLLTEENRTMRDIAGHVPYDVIAIIVNSSKYGGGGIYNMYCDFTMYNQYNGFLMLHEFGHAFAGLADEYYAGKVSYVDFFPEGVEPTAPNITSCTDPAKIKWRTLLSPGIELPTPWDKSSYDIMTDQNKKLHRKNVQFQGKVGAFEGAGYRSTGLYRSMIDCTMFSVGDLNYCRVCQSAITRMILHYTE